MINETAQQHAWYMGRNTPNQSDIEFAVQFVETYNQQRQEMGLTPLNKTEQD